ncbi:ATP-binding cassette sub-family G member 1 [Blattella germanica]|nr:ATP-binding cassette sub-family G member 1 [Blattella germanica]
MDVLNLEAVSKTLVCRLSGGEKKRLSIGLELLKNPPFMFVDEPTSGLDSASAFQVISHLKMLAKRGRTVVCSIHQPSSRLFEMFDDAYLMDEGQCLYSGTLNDMTNILGELGFQCPNFYNRADFAIEIACGLRGGNKENLIAKFGSSMLGSEAVKKIETIQIIEVDEGANLELSYPVSTWMQFQVLFKRSFLCFKRDLDMESSDSDHVPT